MTKGSYGFEVTFQEQVGTHRSPVHTHIWIDNEKNPDIVYDLYDYVAWHGEYYPKRTTLMAYVVGWVLSEDETGFEGPDPVYELVIDRKLSQTHIDHIMGWLAEVLTEFLPRRGMQGLFGETE